MKLKSNIIIKESDIILLIIILILIVSFIFIKLFTYRSEPILMDYAKRKSNNIISSIINKAINDVIYKDNYKNIIEIEKDNNGIITNLNFDNKKINEILYLTTENLLDSINELESNSKKNIFYVPMGVIHDTPILVNIGPKIPFIIEIIGSTNNYSYNNIKEYGINSSIVEVFIRINMQIQVILPFRSEIFSIDKDILLDSKIVQGEIPNYYGGLFSNSLK